MLKKKILASIILCFSVILGITMYGCGEVEKIVSIKIVDSLRLDFMQGDIVDISDLTIEATFMEDDEEKTYILKQYDENGELTKGLQFDPIDTSRPGSNTMTVKYTDESGKTVQTSIPYHVYGEAQTIKRTADLLTKLVNGTSEELLFAVSAEYDMSEIAISRSVKLIGKTGANVQLRDVKVNATNANDDIDVTFNNVTLTNTYNNNGKILDCSSAETKKLNLNVVNCKVVSNGKCSVGMNLPQYGNIVIDSCSFETPNVNEGLFQYIAQFSGSRSYASAESCVFKNNNINCNFTYGLSVYNATIDNNTVIATLKASGLGEGYANKNSQRNFVSHKNPIFIHNSAELKENEKMVLKVTNNYIANVQNVIRTYYIDEHATNEQEYKNRYTFDFKNNNIQGAGVLLSTSMGAYMNAQRVLADIKKGVNAGSIYSRETKYVIEKDTEFTIGNGEIYFENIEETDTLLYCDLDGVNTNYGKFTFKDNNNENVDCLLVARVKKANSNEFANGTIYILRDAKDNAKFYVIKNVSYGIDGDIQHFMGENGAPTTNIAEAKVYTYDEVVDIMKLQ